MKLWIFILMMSLLMLSFGKTVPKTGPGVTPKKSKGNIFTDKVRQQIYSLQNQRDVQGLKAYTSDSKAEYRKAAATAFASVQSVESIDILKTLLSDPVEEVRSEAAYALGQTRNVLAEPFLISAFEKETSPRVKRTMLEAIGKCGTTNGLIYLSALIIPPGSSRDLILEGQAWGLYRFVLQNHFSAQSTARIFELLGENMPGKVRFIAANYLARAAKEDFSGYYKDIIRVYSAEKNLYTRMGIVLGMGLAKHPEILDLLKSIVESKEDYRLRVNAIRALGKFEYKQVKDLVLEMVLDPNVHVSTAASEYFPGNGIPGDTLLYFTTAQKTSTVRSMTNLLNAALKFSTGMDFKKKVSTWIKEVYKKSSAVHEKAYFLSALGADLNNLSFVEQETFAYVGKEAMVSTNGIYALIQMCGEIKRSGDKEGLKGFVEILKKAIKSGDIALVASAAEFLRDTQLDFKTIIDDWAFLTEALNSCRMPQDLEAWQALKAAVDYFNGNEPGTALPLKNDAINWDLVTSIPADQKVKLKTSKGDIIIRLMVDESPGSVSNFIRLIREGFFKTQVFHRVVPNFVIQDGCPRGDGTGGPVYTIGSEFGPLYYEEGSVGMASAGKDTEGSQWFITHSPTPHLDGRYSIFGKVAAGMDVVHRIEVGDRILLFEIQ